MSEELSRGAARGLPRTWETNWLGYGPVFESWARRVFSKIVVDNIRVHSEHVHTEAGVANLHFALLLRWRNAARRSALTPGAESPYLGSQHKSTTSPRAVPADFAVSWGRSKEAKAALSEGLSRDPATVLRGLRTGAVRCQGR